MLETPSFPHPLPYPAPPHPSLMPALLLHPDSSSWLTGSTPHLEPHPTSTPLVSAHLHLDRGRGAPEQGHGAIASRCMWHSPEPPVRQAPLMGAPIPRGYAATAAASSSSSPAQPTAADVPAAVAPAADPAADPEIERALGELQYTRQTSGQCLCRRPKPGLCLCRC